MIRSLVLSTQCLAFASALRTYYTAPIEDNVFSPEFDLDDRSPIFCETNEDGVGGREVQDFIPISYNYEVELSPPPGSTSISDFELDDVVFNIENGIANFLLTTSTFAGVTCEQSPQRRLQPRRSLEAVGISVAPFDTVLPGK